MNRKNIGSLVIGVSLLGVILVSQVYGSSLTPGSASDPVVTKAYVDEKINQLLVSLKGEGGTLSNNNTSIENNGLENNNGENNEIENKALLANEAYTPVFATKGQVLIGGEGCEIILRSGTAKAHIPGENGIVNVSSSIDLLNGEAIGINELLIVPRADGRGVYAVEDCWFLIKGYYEFIS